MDIRNIQEKLDAAIAVFLQQENDTLTRGLNEGNFSSALYHHLRHLFEGYDVDAEYNGDIDKPNDRKALEIAKSRIKEVRRKTSDDDNYNIRPDIIIHKRGSNEHNLVVIEVKKDISPQKHKDFDLIKLEHLTIDYLGNHYNYKVGVTIVFGTRKNAGTCSIKYFQNGLETEKDKLS